MSDRLCAAQHPMPPRRWCHMPFGHHGRHDDQCGLPCTWPNENETRPCPETEVAALGVVGDPARVRCGLLYDHDGPHRFAIEWRTTEEYRGAS